MATVYGTNNNDNLVGTAGNDIMWGYGGDDILNGMGGADTMQGGTGNDTYYVDNVGDVVIEYAGEGIDTVFSSVSYTLGANVERMVLTGADAINGTGNDLDNTFYGNGAYGISNTGANQFTGGLGNDTYYLGAGDTVVESAGQGTDTVVAGFTSYTLEANVENLNLSHRTANVTAIGNELNNVIAANGNYSSIGGNDVVDGGLGADTMSARGGSDTYYVDNAGDTVIEYAGEGTDTVISSVSHTLGANVENITLTGGGLVATGNDSDNKYTINHAGNSVVEGVNAGTDSVYSSVNYTLDANVENLTLVGTNAINGTGNELDNRFYTQSNTVENVLTGGLGNDYYSIYDTGDTVVELQGQGVDTVAVHHVVTANYSGYPTYTEFLTNEVVTYTLGANVENLTLHTYLANGFSYKAYGVGNALDNVIIAEGSTNTDVLDGGAGADTMSAGGANDTYYVDNVGDVVIEDAGAETGTDTVISTVSYTLGANVEYMKLVGSGLIATGNNLNNAFYIDNAGNSVVEGVNGGTDTVLSSVSYTLDANVEQIVLSGAGAINGTGNALDNFMYGGGHGAFGATNSGANVLAGGLGNDTYYLGAGDTVVESAGQGTDTVVAGFTSYTLEANVENLNLSHRTANVTAIGNELNNVITANGNYSSSVGGSDVIDGGAGADTISAGLGTDILTGGTDSDIFVFNTALGTSNVDTITDFTSGSDSMQLALAMFGGIGATGALSASAFVSGAGVTSATTSAEHIAYNTSTGKLYYDADGVGGNASVAFATLSAQPTLTAADFAIV